LKELYIWSKAGQVLLLILFLLTVATTEIKTTNVDSIFPSANAQFIANNPFPSVTSPLPLGPPISPWFPSVPAIACGGLFSLTITGKPHLNLNVHGSGNNNKDLLALQVTSIPLFLPNGTILFSKVDGTVAQGKKNIEHNKLHDFNVKNVFNNCRMLAYSKSKNPHITTPVPTMKNGIVTDAGFLANSGSNSILNPIQTCPVGYRDPYTGSCTY